MNGTRRLILRLLLGPLAIILAWRGAWEFFGAYQSRADQIFTLITLLSSAAAAFGFICQLPQNKKRGAALNLGVVMTLEILLLWILVPTFNSARVASHKTTCLSNVKQLSWASLIYSADFDDRMPAGSHWRTVTEPYRHPGDYRCPDGKSAWSYAMNASLSKVVSAEVARPMETVFLFEADGTICDATGSAREFVARHSGVGTVGFADGHAKYSTPDRLVWKP